MNNGEPLSGEWKDAWERQAVPRGLTAKKNPYLSGNDPAFGFDDCDLKCHAKGMLLIDGQRIVNACEVCPLWNN